MEYLDEMEEKFEMARIFNEDLQAKLKKLEEVDAERDKIERELKLKLVELEGKN